MRGAANWTFQPPDDVSYDLVGVFIMEMVCRAGLGSDGMEKTGIVSGVKISACKYITPDS
jgi:hypothetical protein